MPYTSSRCSQYCTSIFFFNTFPWRSFSSLVSLVLLHQLKCFSMHVNTLFLHSFTTRHSPTRTLPHGSCPSSRAAEESFPAHWGRPCCGNTTPANDELATSHHVATSSRRRSCSPRSAVPTTFLVWLVRILVQGKSEGHRRRSKLTLMVWWVA